MPFQTFTEGVPNPPNFPAIDVNTMLQNNNSINRIFSNALSPNLDNIGFNDNDGGFHHQISMPTQGAPGLQGMDGVLYCDNNGGNAWPIWQNALGTLQLSGSAAGFTVNTTANGATTLPGGLIVNWGNFAHTTAGVAVIPMNVNFPTRMIWANVSVRATAGSATLSIQNNLASVTNNLNVLVGGIVNSIQGIYWIAIGI